MTKLHRVCSIAVVLLAATSSVAQTIYFPNGAFDSYAKLNKLLNDWYSRQLTALHEPSLLTQSKNLSVQSYRFLWLRTFHQPIAVRLEVKADGTGILTTKIASGAGGYAPGHLVTNTSKPLTEQQTESFLHKIDVDKFWELPPVLLKEQQGDDGSQWIIEGVKGGKYHIASQWSPEQGPIHDLGTVLAFELAELQIPKSEIY
jgi:hypothetical protein